MILYTAHHADRSTTDGERAPTAVHGSARLAIAVGEGPAGLACWLDLGEFWLRADPNSPRFKTESAAEPPQSRDCGAVRREQGAADPAPIPRSGPGGEAAWASSPAEGDGATARGAAGGLRARNPAARWVAVRRVPTATVLPAAGQALDLRRHGGRAGWSATPGGRDGRAPGRAGGARARRRGRGARHHRPAMGAAADPAREKVSPRGRTSTSRRRRTRPRPATKRWSCSRRGPFR
jgi:hypothetical protein